MHQHFQASPETFLKVMAPYRDDLVVAVDGLFTWYGRADLCTREGIACVLGHALDMKAIHGGNAKNDRIDAQNIAVRLRGGRLPQAYVSPAERRATRDLLRRRGHLMRTRAELLTPLHNTKSQDHRPESGKQLADQANRDGVAERFSDPAVQQRIAVDLALSGHDDARLRDVERSSLTAATQHHANTLSLLRTVAGIGAIWSLGLRSEMHEIQRVPRRQEFVSYGRLVKGANESAGTRDGTSGTKMGHASRNWAFSEAAVLCRRAPPTGPTYLGRLANQHGQGKALTVVAHKLARALYSMWHRHTAFDMHKVLTA